MSIDRRIARSSGCCRRSPSRNPVPARLALLPCRADAGCPGCRKPDGASLLRRARRPSSRLAAPPRDPRGRSGSRVLLALPIPRVTVVAGLALHALGATSVQANRQWSAEVLDDVVARSRVIGRPLGTRGPTWGVALAGGRRPRVGVHRGALPTAFRTRLAAYQRRCCRRRPRRRRPRRGRTGPASDPSPDGPALVLYTSGSTGRPHGVSDLSQRRCEHPLDRGVPRPRRRGSRHGHAAALLLLRPERPSDPPVRRGSVFLDNRMAFPRTVLEGLATEACTGFAGVPLDVRDDLPAGGRVDDQLPPAAIRHAGGWRDGARHDRRGCGGRSARRACS